MASEKKFGGLEFVINEQRSSILEAALEKIQDLFQVKVELKEVFGNQQQWVCVNGAAEAANTAKEYILALTSPAEVIHMKNIWGHPWLTPGKLSEIERSSCAVLGRLNDNDLAIQGTELAIMLAQSMIDDMFSKAFMDMEDGDMGVAGDVCMEEAWLNEKGGEESAEGPALNRNTFTSGAHAMLPERKPFPHEILQNSTFASASAVSLTSKAFPSQEPLVYPHPLTSAATSTSAASLVYPHPTTATRSVNQPRNASTSNNVKSRGHKKAVGVDKNSSSSESPPLAGSSIQSESQRDYLRGLAQSLHHSAEDIEAGLASYNMDDVVVPSQFLKTLNNIKALHHRGGRPPVQYGNAVSALPGSVGGDGLDASIIMLDDSSLLDESVVCVGSVGSNEEYVLISSEDEDEDNIPPQRVKDNNLTRPAQLLEMLGSHLRHLLSDFGNLHQPSSILTSAPVTHAPPRYQDVAPRDPGPRPAPPRVPNTVALQPAPPRVPNTVARQPAPARGSDTFSHRPALARGPTPPNLQRDREVTSDRAASNGRNCSKPAGGLKLRYIVIDGSNVAMAHGDNKKFSVEGLKICIDYFLERGHERITAFVPEWRRYNENQTSIIGRGLLEKLNQKGIVKFTPARRINGKTIASYDDRYILNLAEKEDGVIVSNDQFRDLCQERASYQRLVANRLLQFMFVGDHFMPPDDPLGRHGPHLDQFLICSEQLQDPGLQGNRHELRQEELRPETLVVGTRQRSPRGDTTHTLQQKRTQPERSPSLTRQLFSQLTRVFPNPQQARQINEVLNNHSTETDLNRLTNYCMNALFT